MKYFFREKKFEVAKVIWLLLFSFSFSFVSYSQGKKIVESRTIVFINKQSFDDKKTGIPKLANAYDQMEMLDCFPSPCSGEVREKLSKKIVEPVLDEISDLIKNFENKFNLIILDAAELDEKRIFLAVDERFEITNHFISYFNNRSKSSVESFEFPNLQSKTAVINTNKFYDKANGLKDFSDSADCLKTTNLCSKITNAITSFAKKNAYSFILDSGKDLPKEVSNYQLTDVTQQFISEFNKNN